MPVYMVQAGGGPVKIGHSQTASLVSRLASLQSSNHERLTILRVLDGGYALERSLHQRFKLLWMHGEWFAFHTDMLGDLGAADCPEFLGIQIALPYGSWTDARRIEISAWMKNRHQGLRAKKQADIFLPNAIRNRDRSSGGVTATAATAD